MASFEELIDGLPPVLRKIVPALKKLWAGDSTRELAVKGLTADSVQLNTAAGVTVAEGELAYNADEETANLGLGGESVLQLGLETLYHAQNDSGVDMDPGFAAMFAEAIGNSGRGRIIAADLSDPANVPLYLGPVTQLMADGAVGKITEFGRNRGLNCSGVGAGKLSFGDETWLDGQSVFVDPDNPQYFTNTPPASPKVKVRAGFVLSNNAVTGTLFVISNHFDEQLAWGDRVAGDYVSIVNGIVEWHGNSSLVLDSVSGKGIKIDTAAPTFGWHDIVGQVFTRGFGGSEPAFAIYQGRIRQHQFGINDEIFDDYHIPHDYAPATDLFIHVHWSHIAAALLSGATTWEFEISYAKGHDQAPFTQKTITLTQDGSLVQFQHLIGEVQITNDGGDATHFDRADIETDGLLIISTILKTNTLSDGATVAPFAHFIDIHYQSTGLPTKNKVPSFY